MKHEEIYDLVGVAGKIIIENERLYDIKQESLKIESLSYDEYVNYEYLNMVQNFHKDFSFFIHDNVLQNILALKKLIESMSTENVETKKLVLETFDTLNKTYILRRLKQCLCRKAFEFFVINSMRDKNLYLFIFIVHKKCI